MRTTIMLVPQGFKIRKKSDIDTFINKCMQKGNRYDVIADSGLQFIFEKDNNSNISVSMRSGDLTDMFNPSLEVARTNNNCYKEIVESYIWKNRKYINKKWFNEGRD